LKFQRGGRRDGGGGGGGGDRRGGGGGGRGRSRSRSRSPRFSRGGDRGGGRVLKKTGFRIRFSRYEYGYAVFIFFENG